MGCPACGEEAVDPGESCPACGADTGAHDERPATALGLDRNAAAALAYSLTFVTGLLFYLLEDDGFVRFHAAQSVVVFGGLSGLLFVVEVVGGLVALSAGQRAPAAALFGAVASVLGVVGTAMWLLLMYKAARGERFELPVAGGVAERYA